ncbi:metal ABC transporter permease [Luteipulveratus sp. YIM 133132]|uniref:Metal ABC transporter permease n=1 Tax=Luteipulveratus flavus TaxID=3031728 RepID=A0ABT6C3P6_9MICO|nr:MULTISPECIES: metal ABC transporter permease [unclassified Luteipulveratus]MDE9367550.1 metal ABC transporter permease [Luteipulveratus sp. YIM 133132]MDF8263385.1 metal ABC transporter permease [Luteipulveratus sp. YIM 133296]
MLDLLSYDFMQRALIAALLVGLAAPMVGIFLVQRRLSLIGDGMGHVSLAGVAVGLFTGNQPVATALIFAVAAAVLIEVVRARGNTSGDVALAIMFYGGIAVGVVLISKADTGTPTNLDSYLFGAITTTSRGDVWTFAVLAAVIVVTTWVLRPRLFAVANDEEYARATGMRVTALNIALAVLTAITVVVSMRVVGLLLISALMIVPNAASQLLTGSFRAALRLAVVLGVVASVGGVATSYYADTPSGGTIVILTIVFFVLASVLSGMLARRRGRRQEHLDEHDHEHGAGCGHPAIRHGDHVDYLHDGERHAAHADHWDEHHIVAAGQKEER